MAIPLILLRIRAAAHSGISEHPAWPAKIALARGTVDVLRANAQPLQGTALPGYHQPVSQPEHLIGPLAREQPRGIVSILHLDKVRGPLVFPNSTFKRKIPILT